MDLSQLEGYFEDDGISFGYSEEDDSTASSSYTEDDDDDPQKEKPLDFHWENEDGFHFGPSKFQQKTANPLSTNTGPDTLRSGSWLKT